MICIKLAIILIKFSAVALRFADELYPTPDELASIGDLVEVNGQTQNHGKNTLLHLIIRWSIYGVQKIKMTKSIKGKGMETML